MDRKPPMEKKRHHFIPITYLERFCGEDGRVWAYRKDDVLSPLHVRPLNIAFERYYYSQPLPGGGRDNNFLENLFSKLEGGWPDIAEILRSGIANYSNLQDIIAFLSLMRTRIPAARDVVELMRAEQVKEAAKILDAQGKFPPKPEGYEDILDQVTVAIDPHQSLVAMPELIREFANVVGALGFKVIHNDTDILFLTSDSPVIYFDPTVSEEKILPYQVRPRVGSVELLFSVASDSIIRDGSWIRDFNHVNIANKKEVKRMNKMIVRFGYRFVFSCDQTHKKLIEKYADISPVLKMTTQTGTKGTMYFESVFGPRPTKPKWTN